jgi:hypothetical protein
MELMLVNGQVVSTAWTCVLWFALVVGLLQNCVKDSSHTPSHRSRRAPYKRSFVLFRGVRR